MRAGSPIVPTHVPAGLVREFDYIGDAQILADPHRRRRAIDLLHDASRQREAQDDMLSRLSRAELKAFYEEWLRLVPPFRLDETLPIIFTGGIVIGMSRLPLRWSHV